MIKKLDASEEEILLVPACYNKKGLLGDFQVGIHGKGILRPYTSVGEYFNFFDDAKYVYAYLVVAGDPVFYKISREDYENDLKGLEPLTKNFPNITVI